MAENVIRENDTSDADSTHTANTDSSASIASSVLNYEYENGRRYARSEKYFLPNDEAEQDRLDLLHHIFLLILGGRLYLAPITSDGKTPKRVLDIGTGTGIWATQLADELPDTEVIGVDLSPIQPSWVPPNIRFILDDIELPWTYPTNETFDFIHQRALSGSIKDWPALFRQAFQHTKPGGWYEAQEYPIEITSDDGTHEKAKSVIEWCRLVEDACERQGRPIAIAHKLKGWLEEAGFVDVHEEILKAPLNPWSTDPQQKEIGKYYLVQAFEAAESFVLQLYTKVLGKSIEETQAFVDQVRSELADPDIHLYAPYRFVYGRRPEVEGI